MKATHLLATIISLMHAMPCGATTGELETLRQRCLQQEQRIVQLEKQLKQLGAQPAPAVEEKSVAKSSAASESHSERTYTVQAGDNVDKIARRHGCSVAALNALNDLQEKTVIFPGQTLKVPAKAQAQPAEAKRLNDAPAPAKEPGRTHTIQQGDTYTSISRKYKIPVNTLVAMNPEVKATALRPGLKIRLSQPKSAATAQNEAGDEAKSSHPPKTSPASSSGKSTADSGQKTESAVEDATTRTASNQTGQPEKPKADPASPATTATPPPSAGAPAAPPAVDAGNKSGKRIRPVKIEEPMTYGEFAAKHGTTPERLNDLNGLDLTQATVLAKGSELYVPAQP